MTAAALAALAPRPAAADEAVAIVDLRPGDPAALRASRAAFAASLAGIQGIAIRDDAGLDAALAGAAGDGDGTEAAAALAEARDAYGALDCARATAAADRAIEVYAARQASGLDDGHALRAAWTYVLLCADAGGAAGRARLAADRLRGLGVASADQIGVPAATWRRYPEIDAATDRDIVALTITTEPAGAAVWVDHRAVGASPVTVYVPAGEHVVAASESARRGAVRVTTAARPVTAAVPLHDRSGPWAGVGAVVAGWRAGRLTPTAEALGTVMDQVGVRFAIVLAGTSAVQVWARGPGDPRPRKLDDVTTADTMSIGAMISDRVAAWDGRAPDPDLPLLVESDDERAARQRGKPTQWWVYAAIVGAVAAGTVALYLHDTAEHTQRIELRW